MGQKYLSLISFFVVLIPGWEMLWRLSKTSLRMSLGIKGLILLLDVSHQRRNLENGMLTSCKLNFWFKFSLLSRFGSSVSSLC